MPLKELGLKTAQPEYKRYPRIERDEVIEVHEDENSHLWAVSYSDFLMALLSFFILFFSMDQNKRQNIILTLTQEFSQNSNTSGPTANAGFAGLSGQGTLQSQPQRAPNSFYESLKEMNIKTEIDKESLVINFPDDLFGSGKYNFSKEQAAQLMKVLNVLKNHNGEMNLYFEGHTDDRPLKIHKNEILVDNYVLSSLRASSALRLAKDMGFIEKNLFIQAASSNTRNTRSLSLRIEVLQAPENQEVKK